MERCVVCITTWQRRQAESQIPTWFFLVSGLGQFYTTSAEVPWTHSGHAAGIWCSGERPVFPVVLSLSLRVLLASQTFLTLPYLHEPGLGFIPQPLLLLSPPPQGRPHVAGPLLLASCWPVLPLPALCTHGNPADITPPGSQGDWENEMPGCLPDQASMSLSIHWSHWGHPQITVWSSLPDSLLWESPTQVLSSSKYLLTCLVFLSPDTVLISCLSHLYLLPLTVLS